MPEGDDYSLEQGKRDQSYRKIYRAWFTRLPKAKRDEMRKMGLHDLPKDQIHSGRQELSAFSLSDATEMAPDTAVISEELRQEHQEQAGKQDWKNSEEFFEEVHACLRRILGEIKASSNPALTVDCLSAASGLCTYQGETQVVIARNHGCTRAAVSKRCVHLTEQIGLPPSRAMRSLTARKAYASTQFRIRANSDRFGRKRSPSST